MAGSLGGLPALGVGLGLRPRPPPCAAAAPRRGMHAAVAWSWCRIRSHGQQEEGRMCKRKAACAGAKRSGERRTTRMLRPTAPPARRMRTVGKAPRGRRKAGATGSLQATYTTHAACLHRWLPCCAAHAYATCTRHRRAGWGKQNPRVHHTPRETCGLASSTLAAGWDARTRPSWLGPR